MNFSGSIILEDGLASLDSRRLKHGSCLGNPVESSLLSSLVEVPAAPRDNKCELVFHVRYLAEGV